MFILDATWAKIREQFSEAERKQLREAVAGTVICPRGVTINETKLDVVLEFKIIAAVKNAQA